jgi:hypothetical protein
LETPKGAPAEPPTLSAAVPNWRPGDTIHIRGRTLPVPVPFCTQHPLGAVVNRPSVWSDR